LAEKLRSFGENITGSNCGYERMIIDREWLRLNPNSGSKRTFDVFVTAGQTLLNKLRSDFNVEEEEYRDLSAFNDQYAGVERFDRGQAEYRQAFEEDDVPRMIQVRSAILADLDQARERKQLLIAPQLQMFETRLRDVEDAVRVARSDNAQAEQSRLMIAQRESAARQLSNAASREELKGAFDEQFVQSANEVISRLSTLRSVELWLIPEKRGEIQGAMQQLDSLEQRVAAAQLDFADFMPHSRAPP
jgi:hypothetical protein